MSIGSVKIKIHRIMLTGLLGVLLTKESVIASSSSVKDILSATGISSSLSSASCAVVGAASKYGVFVISQYLYLFLTHHSVLLSNCQFFYKKS